nr:phospholipase A1-IIgamma-like [Ipomoea batatas]
MGSIAEKWEVLSGSTNWEGLINPLDIDLRNYLIHYGEMTQATHDAFNAESASKFAGTCRFSEPNLFAKVGLEKGKPYKYEVTKYFYATSSYTLPDPFIVKSTPNDAWSRESNWMGGFYFIYTSENPNSAFNATSARDQILSEMKRLVELYKDEEVSITICGHSLGAALATLNAIDIVTNGINKTSAGKEFPTFLPRLRSAATYKDVGVELRINVTKSGYVKPVSGVWNWHNLEGYLHGIAGTKGVGVLDGFEMVVDRDISLVNKSQDYLREEYCVPGNWWIEKNKGMVQKDDGSWELMGIEEGYIPIPP